MGIVWVTSACVRVASHSQVMQHNKQARGYRQNDVVCNFVEAQRGIYCVSRDDFLHPPRLSTQKFRTSYTEGEVALATKLMRHGLQCIVSYQYCYSFCKDFCLEPAKPAASAGAKKTTPKRTGTSRGTTVLPRLREVRCSDAANSILRKGVPGATNMPVPCSDRTFVDAQFESQLFPHQYLGTVYKSVDGGVKVLCEVLKAMDPTHPNVTPSDMRRKVCDWVCETGFRLLQLEHLNTPAKAEAWATRFQTRVALDLDFFLAFAVMHDLSLKVSFYAERVTQRRGPEHKVLHLNMGRETSNVDNHIVMLSQSEFARLIRGVWCKALCGDCSVEYVKFHSACLCQTVQTRPIVFRNHSKLAVNMIACFHHFNHVQRPR